MAKVGETFGGGVFRISGIISNLKPDGAVAGMVTFSLTSSTGESPDTFVDSVGVMTKNGLEKIFKKITLNVPFCFRFEDSDGRLRNGMLVLVCIEAEELRRAKQVVEQTGSVTIHASSVL